MQNYIQNNPELTLKIEKLFGSRDESNLALACELMKGGGIPPSILKKLAAIDTKLYFFIHYGLAQPLFHHHLLDLSRLGLNSVPSELVQLTQLQCLNLFYNHLSILPKEICQLLQLKKLLLHHNQLTFLPETIGNLTKLEELALCFNQLTKLPQAISQLTQLKTLYLHNNQLTNLPYRLSKLPHLQKITLWGNAFTIEEETRLLDMFENTVLIF